MSFINSNWYIAGAFCFVFFVGGRQLGEVPGGSRRSRRAMGLILLLFALPSFLFPLAWASEFIRLAPWYNTFRAINRIELFTSVAAPFAGYATYMDTKRQAAYMGRSGPGLGSGHRGRGRGRGRRGGLWPQMRRRRGGARDGSALKRFFKPLALPLSLLLVSSCFLRPLVMPIDKDTAFASNWTSGILMQSAPSGSGPAALATVMNTLNGYEGDEFDMCRRTNTDAGGTDFWQLARYASGKGYKYEFLSEADSGAIPTPCVARMSPGGAVRAAGSGTSPGAAENADRATPAGSSAGSASGSASGSSSGSSAYYVALLDNKDGKLTVGDPQRGRTELTYDEFLERYPYSGLVLAISSAARPAR